MIIRPYNPSPYDDDFEDQPTQGWFYKWISGVAIPVSIMAYALMVFVNGDVTIDRSRLHLQGHNATAFASAAAALAVFLHCHYFWGNIYNQAWWAVLGKILSAMVFIAALGVLLVRVGVLGLK